MQQHGTMWVGAVRARQASSAAEACSVDDIPHASSLDEGEAISPIYEVWGEGDWTENGTVRVGAIGFPAVVGQQACLFVTYNLDIGANGCQPTRTICTTEAERKVLLASRAFVAEQRPPPTTAPAALFPATPVVTPPVTPPPAPSPQPSAHRRLTIAEHLRLALKRCRRTSRRRHTRNVCERHARKKYRRDRHAS
jgi:hypothetical protein